MTAKLRLSCAAFAVWIFGVGLFSVALSPASAWAAASDEVKKGVTTAGGKQVCKNDKGDEVNCVNEAIRNVVNLLSIIVGVAAVIVVIIAGLMFITATGDSGKVARARSTLLYAVIGLIVAAMAQVIVRFLLERVS